MDRTIRQGVDGRARRALPRRQKAPIEVNGCSEHSFSFRAGSTSYYHVLSFLPDFSCIAHDSLGTFHPEM